MTGKALTDPNSHRMFTVFTHLGGPLYLTLIAGAVTLLMTWSRAGWSSFNLTVLLARLRAHLRRRHVVG